MAIFTGKKTLICIFHKVKTSRQNSWFKENCLQRRLHISRSLSLPSNNSICSNMQILFLALEETHNPSLPYFLSRILKSRQLLVSNTFLLNMKDVHSVVLLSSWYICAFGVNRQSRLFTYTWFYFAYFKLNYRDIPYFCERIEQDCHLNRPICHV